MPPPKVTLFGRRLASKSSQQLHKTGSIKSRMSNIGRRVAAPQRRYMSSAVENSGPSYRSMLDSWAKSGNRVAGATAKILNTLGVAKRGAAAAAAASKAKARKIEPPKLSTEARNALHVWMNSNEPECTPEGKRLDELAKEVRHSKPTSAMYTYLLNGLAHSANEEAGTKALKLLQEMQAKGIPTTGESYAFAVDAWAQPGSRDAGEMAEQLMKEMLKCNIQPTAETYKACMNAWAKSGAFEAGEMAEKLLLEMQTKGIKPSTETYTIVLDAWARAGLADGYKVDKKKVEEIN